MRISASISTGLGLDRRAHTPAPAHGAESPVRSQLPAVIETPALRGQSPAPARSVAALIAQLVAHAEDMPETRARRRADAGYGTNAYRTVAELGPRPDLHTARVI
jgi:hypothetical protein